ncbi:MAG: hypothetical protein MI975_22405 [Cytophagales bacterium]|nr:hypothetical protein [Cytophagales bacterium]
MLCILAFSIFGTVASGQQLKEFTHNPADHSIEEGSTRNKFQFNGYTNYWHDIYRSWHRYGNLFKMSVPDIEKNILQSKVDIADDMGLPGLILQEGFMSGLLSDSYQELDEPDSDEIIGAVSQSNVLVFTDPSSTAGQMLISKLSDQIPFPIKLKSHQYGSTELARVDAFYLENNGRKIFVVSSPDKEAGDKLRMLISDTKEITEKYDLHKGWFGAETLLKSVTCTEGHPLDVIGRGMNEGNTWFVFSGYMDFLAKDELENWMKMVDLPVVTDAGFWPVFGCKDYKGLQVQSMFTKESWINYAREKQGYVFRQVWDTLADPYKYDGYLAVEGNKMHIDKEDVPFILRTGRLDQDALASMVLFLEKDRKLTRESMWEAIMARREVGVLEMGKMMGPAYYRNALQLLLLDRIFLEDYFSDKINITTRIEDYDLEVTIENGHESPTSGILSLRLPSGLNVAADKSVNMSIPANSRRVVHFPLSPTVEAMDRTNPIAIHYDWDGGEKSTLAMMDLPQAISVHRLLYGHAPRVKYPVTIHNFTKKSSFPVKLEVIDENDKIVYKKSQSCELARGKFKDMDFELEVPKGSYRAKVSALGTEYISQLGVGAPEGKPYVYAIDLNSDGVNEYRMENDSVQVTLLATGARVIEYIVKSRNDNILFKLWPKKAIDDKRPFRYRGYYPYGGFEDFLGQGSMETHQIYDCEIEQSDGDFVRVRMWTDYYGNRLQKTFTLYGNSPLLEVRFALTFKNPEANVLGPQPILEIGKRHWTEDVFTVPELDGLHEYRMKPEKYYGRVFFLKEGWNAGYDTKEDITFVGAFPVDQPLFLHMWMNHPRNGDAHHYYSEFQPWTPIYQRSTMYFSYYIWGAGGPWENGVKSLRKRNLITSR